MLLPESRGTGRFLMLWWPRSPATCRNNGPKQQPTLRPRCFFAFAFPGENSCGSVDDFCSGGGCALAGPFSTNLGSAVLPAFAGSSAALEDLTLTMLLSATSAFSLSGVILEVSGAPGVASGPVQTHDIQSAIGGGWRMASALRKGWALALVATRVVVM